MLLQQNINAQWQPIAFISRSLTSAEKNYSTTEKELLAIVWAFSKFHQYLHGSSVQVETDHQPLVALLKKHHPPGRLLRWTLALQEYTFTLIYCRDSNNLIADGLPRTEFQAAQFLPPVVDLPLENSQMATLQQQDPHLRELSTQLRSTVTNTAHQQFMLIDHVLHYISKQGKPRIYVPTQLRQTYLEFYHDYPLSGHLGFHKVLEKIRLHYYWPQMRKSVTQHLLNCTTCQQTKTPSRKVGHLQPITVNSPFELVGWDLMGPFPETPTGNRYILVITEYLTRWCEATTVLDTSADTIAHALLHKLILYHGCPTQLLSDQGK